MAKSVKFGRCFYLVELVGKVGRNLVGETERIKIIIPFKKQRLPAHFN
jgi:hypothetical protein